MPGDVPLVFFEILGPLRAWREHTELDLGPGKQRAVLAVLLLNANRPTPTTRIIDAVWGDCPPENGVNVVQKYVAGLRRTLEPGRSPRAPGQILTLTDAGYALRVEPGCLDTDVFANRVEQARAARSAGRSGEAAGHLRAALALWREQALAGLPGPYFETARDRLTDDRAAALETAAEIELDLGHHGRLVPELARLVADFPLREEPRYLLILALYRCGRQAEALAAFRAARHFLTEEFGVEPGERLQRLHLAILRSDPSLAAEPADDGPGGPVVVLAPAPGAPHVPTPSGATTAGNGRRRRWLRRLVAVAVPLASLGVFSWTVIAYFAARRRSVPLGVAAAGYFALVVVFMFASDSTEDSARESVAGLALVLAMAGGAVHALLISGADHRHGRTGHAHRDVAGSLEQRVRREQALTLVEHYPEIAGELHIGRPDLLRVFQDGGLVDINAVPEHVLAALPGVTALQARHIVNHRLAAGGFTSVRDLAAEGLLPVSVVHAMGDILIVLGADPPEARRMPAIHHDGRAGEE
jgi:DNA-binding SARP family transcriptional activator